MKIKRTATLALMLVTSLVFGDTDPLSPGQHDQENISNSFKKKGYSPYAGRNFPTQVFFGDTHLHTGASGDAFGFGNHASPPCRNNLDVPHRA